MTLWHEQGKALWQLKDPTSIAHHLRELVDLQVEVMTYQVGRLSILQYIQSRPDLIINRMINHVLYLFDIQHVDEMVARLNSVYLGYQEMNAFMKSMQIALGLDSKSKGQEISNATICAELINIVTKYQATINSK